MSTTEFKPKLKIRLLLLSLAVMSFSLDSKALVCLDNKQAPLCPDSGTTLLDETYPTQAFVISNQPQREGISSNKVTSEFISAIAKSYNYENMPQVFVPVRTNIELDEIINAIRETLTKRKLPEVKIQQVISQISHVESNNFTWQQDYFETFVDLKTGRPTLREFNSYIANRTYYTSGAVQKMSQAGAKCEITKGEGIVSKLSTTIQEKLQPNDSFGGGEMGGNVEGAPGGFCLIGDNLSKDVASNFCGKKDNVIQLQTSWLNVGHVDEIFKILPGQFNDGRPKECQFTLMAASPKKAFELMQSANGKNTPYNSFSNLLSEYERWENKLSQSGVSNGHRGSALICKFIQNAIIEGSYSPEIDRNQPRQNTNSVKSVFINLILDNAHAVAIPIESQKSNFKCDDHIDRVSNEVIHNALIKDKNLYSLNMQIQKSIDDDKKLIKSKILSRLPQCENYFDELDAPNLFYGSSLVEKDGKLQLPKPGDVDSFLPNPTNSVLMNRTVLLPESGNPTFDSYIEKELEVRKLKTDKINTWDYAHVGNGNIHCASHSIPFCKPRN